MTRLLLAFVLVSNLGSVASAQPQKGQRARLSKNHPTVYVTFVRTGKRAPIYSDESDQGIWLRLHNNTRWQIYLWALDDSPGRDGYRLLYEVERHDASQSPVRLPIGERSDIRRVFPLSRGKSALFSVPREHLTKGLMIVVAFRYGWELDRAGNDEPEHRVYFSSSNLPHTIL